MIKTAHKIITGLIIVLGLIHVFVTFIDYDEFSIRALWFASAGVAIILAGFLNIILLRDTGKDKLGLDAYERHLCRDVYCRITPYV